MKAGTATPISTSTISVSPRMGLRNRAFDSTEATVNSSAAHRASPPPAAHHSASL